VLIAIGNAPEPSRELVAAAHRSLDDPSPLVRGAAVWAFGQIAGALDLAAEAAARRDPETDAMVSAEWRLLAPISTASIAAEPST
jgi:epoxyqueuosine reductase